MIQQLKPSLNRQINSYVAKRFPPSGKQFTFECPCSGIRVQIIQDENNTNRFSDRIGRLVGEQGPPNSVRNHAEVEN